MLKKTYLLFLLISNFLLLTKSFAQSELILPDRMFADSTYTPFYHGVASGDPTPSNVIIWTRISPDDNTAAQPIKVTWELSLDSNFTQVLQSQSIETQQDRDYTVKIDVGDLSAGTTYFYRFLDEKGAYSRVGRTRTAAVGDIEHLRFAVASCSSIFSGYFNAYRRIGDRKDLDAVIHLGDYLYDYPDDDELIRIPEGLTYRPETLAEWRALHAYHCFDPDLRYAKERHPFILLWDNHDLSSDDIQVAIQAFLEWLPVRIPDETSPHKIWRTLKYGNLLDVLVVDTEFFRKVDTLENGAWNILGAEQEAWLQTELLASKSRAKWRFLANQKLVGTWSLKGLPPLPGTGGDVFDRGTWDGFPESRARLLDFLADEQVDNTLILSGDSHVSQLMDVCVSPLDTSTYKPETGEGSVAIEFLPTSISRGNLNERGFDVSLDTIATNLSKSINPHHVHTELMSHGYGIMDVRKDSLTAELWYSDILQVTDNERLAVGFSVDDGRNSWNRTPIFEPSMDKVLPFGVGVVDIEVGSGIKYDLSDIFPNPFEDVFSFYLQTKKAQSVDIQLLELHSGRVIRQLESSKMQANKTELLSISTENLPTGICLLQLKGVDFKTVRKVVKF